MTARSGGARMTRYQLGFILEQALGHVTYAQNLQANIQDPEVEVHWALIPFAARGLASHLPLYRSNWTLRAGLRARRALARLARQAPLEALFFHTQVPAILAADWLGRLPGVVSLDATPLQYDELGGFYGHGRGNPWAEAAKWRLARHCFRAARRLVTWSEWARQGLIGGYGVPADKITVIPPGVDVRAWARPQPRREHDGPCRILFVGGDLERKGGLLLLEAFRALRPLGVELHLVTRGTVPAQEGLYVYRDMEPNSGTLRALYHACDVFCLPTYGDCLPMVLSEAGAAGLPCVSTRVAGIPEIVREGETGFLTPAGDASALTAALRRLVEDPALRLRQGARAVEVVAADFSAERNAQRLVDLLKEVASEGRATRRPG